MARLNLEDRFFSEARLQRFTDLMGWRSQHTAIGALAFLWHESQELLRHTATAEEIVRWTRLRTRRDKERLISALSAPGVAYIVEIEPGKYEIAGNFCQIDTRVKNTHNSKKGGEATRKKWETVSNQSLAMADIGPRGLPAASRGRAEATLNPIQTKPIQTTPIQGAALAAKKAGVSPILLATHPISEVEGKTWDETIWPKIKSALSEEEIAAAIINPDNFHISKYWTLKRFNDQGLIIYSGLNYEPPKSASKLKNLFKICVSALNKPVTDAEKVAVIDYLRSAIAEYKKTPEKFDFLAEKEFFELRKKPENYGFQDYHLRTKAEANAVFGVNFRQPGMTQETVLKEIISSRELRKMMTPHEFEACYKHVVKNVRDEKGEPIRQPVAYLMKTAASILVEIREKARRDFLKMIDAELKAAQADFLAWVEEIGGDHLADFNALDDAEKEIRGRAVLEAKTEALTNLVPRSFDLQIIAGFSAMERAVPGLLICLRDALSQSSKGQGPSRPAIESHIETERVG